MLIASSPREGDEMFGCGSDEVRQRRVLRERPNPLGSPRACAVEHARAIRSPGKVIAMHESLITRLSF